MDALNPAAGYKPLDFGNGQVTGSIDQDGRLIALNAYHAEHGYVTLTTASAFPENARYQAKVVRAYRARLAALQGFGPRFTQPITQRHAFLLENAIPHLEFSLADGSKVSVSTFAVGNGAIQWWRCRGEAPVVQWQGQLMLQRCAYTQLTEGGPLPMPALTMEVTASEGVLVIHNPTLGQAVAITGLPKEAWTHQGTEPLLVDMVGPLQILTFAWGETPEQARAHAQQLAQTAPDLYLENLRAEWQARWHGLPPSLLLRRALAYGLMLCVPVDAGICILTDHMLLPLSWNRDAYYMAKLLLLRKTPETLEMVRRHLIWLFEIAALQEGFWGRAYLANGRIKDRGFQLDQQLFPLLELAEYVTVTDDQSTWQQLQGHIAPIIDALMARKASHTWLFPTDETPADDPIALPYHFSSHVLAWHTFRKLVEAGITQFNPLVEGIRAAIDTHFIAEHDGTPLYAYATDGQGHHHFYHDANDMPLALAPDWGMLTADNPVWRATVTFAFSTRNKDGTYGGRLGSVHTPAPWPLGDIQALIIAKTTGDFLKAQEAEHRLAQAAQWDGALPEAYHGESFAVYSRHWFLWPNAALACLDLEKRP